ncbi:hypothetical protein [Rhizobium binxianense]|uniref:hypothetical protein n=1 Tax=Rhizobium binxianense TaxID=3024242 RepID=UPI00234F3ACE|nr:hypothetical protein [Rhizobium sp. BC56]MDC7741242.1 hypothetical protein [Rhizobium sp. BC56]
MHNIGFIITVFEDGDDIRFEVEFFVRIDGDVVSGTLDEVLVAIGSANLRRILRQEAEKLYAIVSNFLARRHLGNPVEVNFLNIGAFQCVMVAGLGYPARSFADAEELEEALNSDRDDVPKTTIPAP